MSPGVRLGPIAVAAALASTIAVSSLAGTLPVSDRGNRAPRPADLAAPVGQPDQVGQWSSVISWPIVAVHGILMRTGKVLLWEDHSDDPNGALVWNPGTGAFSSTPTNGINLFCAGHCALSDGSILVDGGHIGLDVGINNATAFDPGTQTWTPLAGMAYARWYPTATSLPDGGVAAFSGAINCDGCIAEIPEIYDPAANSWTQLNNAPLALPLYPFMFVLPNGKLLVTGSSEDPTNAYVLNIGTQTWSIVDPVVADGGSAAMFLPGKVVQSGASQNPDFPTGQSVATTYVLDMTQPSPAWRQTSSMAFARFYHNLTLLPDGTVLVTGGSTDPDVTHLSAAVKEAELWSPTTETWTTMASMQKPRLYHSIALLLPDASVLVAGSGRFDGPGQPDPNDQRNAEIYSPPYLFNGPRPTIGSIPATVTYGTSFFLGTTDAASIAKVSLVRPGAVTHAFNADQRFLNLTLQQTAGGLTVQAPANASLAPAGYYMVFIVNTSGVPSVASFVRLPIVLDTELPSSPANLSAVPLPGSVRLTWGAASDNVGVTSYNVHRSTTSGFTPSPANRIAQPPASPYTDGGLTPGTYFYRVTAQDAADNVGPGSNQAAATVTQPPGNLVAAYSCNEGAGPTATDVSGYANDGSLAGATWTTQGKYAGALSFDGTAGFVNLGNPTSLRVTGSITWSAWVKALANPVDDGQIVAKSGSAAGSVGWQLKTSPDAGPHTFAVAVSANGTTNTQRYSTTVRALNTWYHVAGVYNAAAQTLDIHVNGALNNGVLSGTVPASQFDPNLNVNIGRRTGGFYFNGIIDNVRIYNRALTQAEIQDDMNTPIENPSVGTVPTGPAAFSVSPGVPNPFEVSTTLRYTLPREERVRVRVFNVVGELVATLEDRVQPAGTHVATFAPKGLPSGVYVCWIQAGNLIASRKLLLVR